jgi:phage tail-like protein
MTKAHLQSYLFKTEAQWKSCLISGADQEWLHSNGKIRPYAPYDPASVLYATEGGYAPAFTAAGEILWHDKAGFLYRLLPGDESPERSAAAFAIARASRLIAARDLWVSGPKRRSLERYDSQTLTRLMTMELPESVVVDIADGGCDTVLALVKRIRKQGKKSERVWAIVRVDSAGHILDTVSVNGFSRPKRFIFLRRSQRLVVLTQEVHPRLCWFDVKGGRPIFSRIVAAIRPCFVATSLSCDSRDRIFLTGADDKAGYVLVLDGDGNVVDSIPLDSLDLPVNGVAANNETLVLAGPRGLLRFGSATSVPKSTGELRCLLITPMMFSPDRDGEKGWLRMEASATLPEGTTLEITFAATDKDDIRSRLNSIWADASLSASRRIQELIELPDVWHAKTVFHGSARQTTNAEVPLSAPLFDASDNHLWGCVTLIASPGAALPQISQLRVIYPERSLMEELPAIFRRSENSPEFLRSLVGVLEATTQELDGRIGTMSSRLHPDTAPDAWLNFVARWLGVPWDDALNSDQKKNLLQHAADLARSRGTRSGLETLLLCLIPGTPPRFRVTDATADFGFAIVGDATSPGSALPAMLGGPTRWSSELDSHAVLGYTRLPCPGQLEDGAWQLAGKIRIEVAASSKERKQWDPWLRTLLTEMVPVTAQVQLRWVSASALRSDDLNGTLTLEPEPLAHLGTDAVTGQARLPEGKVRLSSCGPEINTRLL